MGASREHGLLTKAIVWLEVRGRHLAFAWATFKSRWREFSLSARSGFRQPRIVAGSTTSHFQGPTAGLHKLRCELAAQADWTATLVDARKLGQLASDLGYGHFFDGDIEGLWHLGLLRADLILGAKASARGIVQVNSETEAYADLRIPEHRPLGYASALNRWSAEELDVQLLFHPYRIYVLHHVARTLSTSRTGCCQYLKWRPGVESVPRREAEHLDRWTGSVDFADRFDYWNRLAEISLICEPVNWRRAKHGGGSSVPTDDWLDSYSRSAGSVLSKWDLHDVRGIRTDLALAANERDPNSTIHTLLRLLKRSERERLKGRLGAAMKLLEMAESIRRAIERTSDIQLPEEDELGPGQWMEGARKMLYGHERVFDAPKRDLRDFLGILGLDFGIKARCYVEGETELGAFRHALGAESQCVLVNLKGNVAERGGRGVAFLDSLAADKAAHVFSVVVLDADRADELRLVKKAAAEERFFGAFFVFKPDVEFGNFTPDELVDVAMAIEKTSSASRTGMNRGDILAVVRGASSGKELERRLRQAGLTAFGKGEAWGEALMSFAIAQPMFPVGSQLAGQERPLISAAKLLLRVEDVGFLRSISHEKLDPDTGRVTTRKAG